MVSDKPPSASSLFSPREFCLGMDSDSSSGRHKVWIARVVVEDNLWMAFGISRPMMTISSILMSYFLLSSAGCQRMVVVIGGWLWD